MILLGIGSLIFEIIEHSHPFRLSSNLITEIIIYTFLLPGLIGLLLELIYVNSEKSDLEFLKVNKEEKVAQYLHDSVGQNVSYLILQLEQLSKEEIISADEALQANVSNLHSVANTTYRQIRQSISMLYDERQEPLAKLLEDKVENLNQRVTKPNIHFYASGNQEPLTAPFKNEIIFIALEALSNTINHAEAQNVWVTLRWSENHLLLQIEDDGIGFNPELLFEERFGLKIMEQRANNIKGELKISSTLNKGTIISLHLPLS